MAVAVSGHDVEPERPGVAPLVVVVAVVLAIVITAAAVYLWKSPALNDARDSATAASTELAASSEQISALEAEVSTLEKERDRLRGDAATIQARLEHVVLRAGSLEGSVGRLGSRIETLIGRLADAKANLHAVTTDLEQTHTRLTDAREQLASAHERAVVAAGPGLADGRYVGSIQGIDTTSSPWRLAMRVTARSTGAPLANAGWRVFVVASQARVGLTTWKDGRDVTMTPWEFERVFDGTAPWNVKMRSSRYWIHVVDGRVDGLGEVQPRRN
jgi:hypothetical protein